MKKLLVLTMILLLGSLIGCLPVETTNKTGTTSEEISGQTYINPVFEPVMADPSIIRAEDGWFYCYATEDVWGYELDSHLVPIIRSIDLVHWEYVGDAFEEKPDWNGFKYIWAPDIQYFDGTYYLYYSLSTWNDDNPGIGVATSSSPEGPFTDHGKLFTSQEIGVANSIDPFVFTEDDGQKWLFFGSFRGIYAIRLSENGFSTVGEKVHIAGNSFEASYVIKKDGYYYLFVSTGSCCDGASSTYSVRVLRSTSLIGPYVDRTGKTAISSTGSVVVQAGNQYVGVGHNSIIKDDNDTYWLVYHGINKDDPYLPNGATRRPLMIDKIIWDSKGWPQIYNFVPSETNTEVPFINEEE